MSGATTVAYRLFEKDSAHTAIGDVVKIFQIQVDHDRVTQMASERGKCVSKSSSGECDWELVKNTGTVKTNIGCI